MDEMELLFARKALKIILQSLLTGKTHITLKHLRLWRLQNIMAIMTSEMYKTSKTGNTNGTTNLMFENTDIAKLNLEFNIAKEACKYYVSMSSVGQNCQQRLRLRLRLSVWGIMSHIWVNQ